MKINARIQRVFTDKGMFKAVASVSLDESFNIHNVRLSEDTKGFFLSMPDRKRPDGTFRDICYPTNTTFRNKMTKAVVEAYNEAVASDESE